MKRKERGQALLATIVGLSLVLLVLLATLTFTQFSGKLVARQLTFQGQALNAAEAGLTEGLSWFQGRAVQPVPTFNPSLAANETENAAIGIVRTYQVSGPPKLKGRYEVTIGAAGGGVGTVDITARRGNPSGAGTIWQLESTGYIWVENDTTKAYNQSPNTIIAKRTLRTEIQKLAIALPQNSAIFSRRASLINVSGQGTVRGAGGFGLCYPSGTGLATTNGRVTGSPAAQQVTYATITPSDYPWDIKHVFGISQQELIGAADVVVTQVSDLPYQGTPRTMPTMSLTVINGNANFTVANPMNGSGVLVVFGDLNVAANSNSGYDGLIYVTGNVVVNAPTSINGAIIAGTDSAGGGVSIAAASDVTEVNYDDAMLSQVRQQMGQYRFSHSSYLVGR